ncbi:MAG TPA: ion channel [Candidatus Binataceae bacterium]|nr:ion channel [Candidatus Binataceae bacterium]
MESRRNNQLIPLTRGARPLVNNSATNNPSGFSAELYLHLLTCSWPSLLAQVTLTFFGVNALFALAYYIDGGVENAHSYLDLLFFSIETMATVGYGKMAPVTLVAHLLMSFEVLIGLLGLALMTGLVFAKFSRPTARIRFSRYAVIANREGVPSLMFRVANVRANQIVEAEMHVVLARLEQTLEGEETRRFYDLNLIRHRNAIFAFSWTAIHPIVPGSPLYGITAESMERQMAWIVVSITGLDETISQTVHARMYYGHQDLLWGRRLADVMLRTADGGFALDYGKFDDVEPAELTPWDTLAEPGRRDPAPPAHLPPASR